MHPSLALARLIFTADGLHAPVLSSMLRYRQREGRGSLMSMSECSCAGPPNGKASEHRAEQGGKAAPPSLQDMMVPLEMNDAEAAKAVWTGTAVEPSPPGNT